MSGGHWAGVVIPPNPGDRQIGLCAIGGCDRPRRARGLCYKHWQRQARTGSTDITQKLREVPILDRILLAPETGCWIWRGSLNHDGYGKVWYHGAWVRAHRVFYVEFIGDILGDLQLDHLCRNRACVNPWHLDPVTHAVNNYRRRTDPIPDAVLREMPGVAA